MVTRPFYARDVIEQFDAIGVGSLTVVLLTGTFTGMVLALQSGITLDQFGARSMVGRLVSASMIKELGPVLTALMGTPWLPDFTGAILFVEETNEAEYRIDRMLTQLSLAGILPKLAGFVFGQCTSCTATGVSYGGFTLSEVLEQHLAPSARCVDHP